ncbi:WD40-repeat-containing domain protein [Gloeopeniophorella convolvens]|nr:WD40-repeat-containing domain protein [Gloeopeniophorella convolvens]
MNPMASTPSKKQKNKPPKSRPATKSALLQPSVEDTSSVAALSAFSPSPNLYAYVSLAVDKHRLRVYDTATGRSVSEYTVDAARVTALSWASYPSKSGNDAPESEDSAPRKKRKKRASLAARPEAESEAAPVVVLGLSTGSVIVFSPSHARVLRTLSHPSSTSPILSLDSSIDVPGVPLALVTSCADSSIRTWNAQSGELLSSIKTDDRSPGTSLSLRPGSEPEHTSFLLAHHSIRLLSTPSDSPFAASQKLTEEARFTGHASSITALRWQPAGSEGQTPRIFASIAEADRHVQLWEMPQVSGAEGKLVASAPLDSDARHISFSQSHDNPTLLVLSASGRVSVFAPSADLASTKTPKKNKEKVVTLSPRSSAMISFKQSTASAQVVSAAFEQEGRIRVAWLAGGVKPVFDVIQYLDESGDFVQDVSVVHKDASAGLVGVEEDAIAVSNKRYTEPTSLSVHSGVEMAQDASADDLADLEGHLNVDLAELSLGQRLTALDPSAAPADAEHSDESDGAVPPAARTPRAAQPSSITLTRTLIQALHSADTKLLETCLSHSDATLITQTVRRLPPQLAVPLLGACVQRLGRAAAPSSQRAAVLVRWVRTVLVVHSGHLMTMPDLVARLAGLHATLTARLTLRESLLSLSGRLDMILQQVDLRASAAPAPLTHDGKKGKAPPGAPGARAPRRYVEGESDDEDVDEAMDVELEEGSDVGSIEDVELGGESGPDDDDSDADDDDEEEDDDEDDDDEEDSEGDEGPQLNGFIDDEAEEDDEESESD